MTTPIKNFTLTDRSPRVETLMLGHRIYRVYIYVQPDWGGMWICSWHLGGEYEETTLGGFRSSAEAVVYARAAALTYAYSRLAATIASPAVRPVDGNSDPN